MQTETKIEPSAAIDAIRNFERATATVRVHANTKGCASYTAIKRQRTTTAKLFKLLIGRNPTDNEMLQILP